MLRALCGRDALYEAVQTVARGVSGRSTQPVQNNAYLEARADHLRLVATDLEFISLEALIPASQTEPGAVTVPARLFAEYVGNLPSVDVELAATASHALALNYGRSNHIEIRGMAAEDFEMLPPLVDPTTFEVEQGLLKEVIAHTRFGASTDETRPTLTGVLLSLQPNLLQMVATDTHRLALRRAPIDMPSAQKREAIVSARALGEVERILHAEADLPAKVAVSDNQIEFAIGTVTVGSRLIEGQFPDYQKVIPESFERRLSVDTRELEGALRRALIVAREDANRVSLNTEDGSLRISAESQDVGEVVEVIGAELEGEDVAVAFNARYLLDAIGVIHAEKVHLELSGPLNPGTVRPGDNADYIYVLMPMQR